MFLCAADYLCRFDMRVYRDLTQLPDFQQTIITIGSFDGVHSGHRRILERVRDLARMHQTESVVITFDPHPRTVLQPDYRGLHLLTTTDEKIELLQQTGIDHVVVVPFDKAFAEQTAAEYVESFLIGRFRPKCIVIGYDHRFGRDRSGGLEFLQSYAERGQFEVIEIPAHEVDELTVSSSKIRTALDGADIAFANRMLEHPFVLSGTVVYGDQIGRTIGFPTANIAITDPHKLILPDGIYACLVGEHIGMLYIGTRPVLDGQNERRIEINLIDFDGDLYGSHLTAHVIGHVRGDMHLDGLEALKRQIEADKQEILAIAAAYAAGEKSRPDVAVVILNFNTQKHLEQYLPSVVQNSGNARIVIADNGSKDDSMDFVRKQYPNIQLIDLQENWGFAEGYNRALVHVKAMYYVLLNSDVEVTPNWIEPIIEAMEANLQIGAAQPKIIAEQRRTHFEHAGAAGGWVDLLGYPFCRGRLFQEVESDQGQYDDAAPCFWATGAALFIRSEVYHNFGGFDGSYFAHYEEIDLCWRIKRAGYAVWCYPQSVVYHLGGGTLGYESPRKVYLNFRNSLLTLVKNEPTTKLLWLIPGRLLLDALAAAMYASKGQFASIKALIRAHWSFFARFGAALRARREAAQQVAQHKIGPADTVGIYRASVVFARFVRRANKFTDLFLKQ
jgi:riboflavin kinase/FMN adenylyltransferase